MTDEQLAKLATAIVYSMLVGIKINPNGVIDIRNGWSAAVTTNPQKNSAYDLLALAGDMVQYALNGPTHSPET